MRTYRKLIKTENEIDKLTHENEQLLENTISMSAVELSDAEKLKKKRTSCMESKNQTK